MKKIILIIGSAAMLLAVCLCLYAVSTPEYALKGIIEDVSTFGMEGLYPHLTSKATKTLEIISSVAESDLLDAVMDFARPCLKKRGSYAKSTK